MSEQGGSYVRSRKEDLPGLVHGIGTGARHGKCRAGTGGRAEHRGETGLSQPPRASKEERPRRTIRPKRAARSRLEDAGPFGMDIADAGPLSQRLEKTVHGGLERSFMTAHRAHPSMQMDRSVSAGYLDLAAIHRMAAHLAPNHPAHLLTFRFLLVHWQPPSFAAVLFLRPHRNKKRTGYVPVRGLHVHPTMLFAIRGAAQHLSFAVSLSINP
jgi:hypothetical protein